MARSGRESLSKLRTLVEELSDRDEGLKRDASLFEAVFKDFPIPVAIWLADSDGLCVSQRASGSTSKGWSVPPPPPDDKAPIKMVSLYQCADLRRDVEQHFKKALKGKQLSFMSSIDGSHIWTRLTPRFREDGSCSGVVGVSWDLTANYRMYILLNKIAEFKCCGGDPEVQALKVAALEAAGESVINKLLQEAER
jgi:hypothetical protein